MARITLMDICDGIADTFDGLAVVLNATAPEVELLAHSYDEVTEGTQDTPSLQIWPELSAVDWQTQTDRTSFGGCARQAEYQFALRAFARPRSQADEDMEAVVRLWDALEAVLEDQGANCPDGGGCTFFGVDGIQGIRWAGAAPRVWSYGGADYAGCEVTLFVRVF